MTTERLDLFKIHPGLVDKFYTMNPKTEILLQNGGELKNDMTVLLAGVINRWNVSDMTEADIGHVPMALLTNRWCKVTELVIRPDKVMFVGVYQDGATSRRMYYRDRSWLVKRTSEFAPSPIEVGRNKVYDRFKREKIIKFVQDAMDEQHSATVLGSMQMEREMLDVAEKTADLIMELG